MRSWPSGPLVDSPEPPAHNLEIAVSRIGLPILRGAAVGVACGAIPAACPAILAINQAVGLAQIASDVYRAYSNNPTRTEGLVRAAEETGRATVSTSIAAAIQAGEEKQLRTISDAIGVAAGAGASGALGADSQLVRIITAETTYRAMEGGVEGFTSWAVEGGTS